MQFERRTLISDPPQREVSGLDAAGDFSQKQHFRGQVDLRRREATCRARRHLAELEPCAVRKPDLDAEPYLNSSRLPHPRAVGQKRSSTVLRLLTARGCSERPRQAAHTTPAPCLTFHSETVCPMVGVAPSCPHGISLGYEFMCPSTLPIPAANSRSGVIKLNTKYPSCGKS
jgi:hypothetical protein